MLRIPCYAQFQLLIPHPRFPENSKSAGKTTHLPHCLRPTAETAQKKSAYFQKFSIISITTSLFFIHTPVEHSDMLNCPITNKITLYRFLGHSIFNHVYSLQSASSQRFLPSPQNSVELFDAHQVEGGYYFKER